MHRPLLLALVIVLPGYLACHQPHQNPQGQTLAAREAQLGFNAPFDAMANNAIASDMSIADVHFIPHTDQLSSAGILRLDRLARWLESHAGIVRYETTLDDAKLLEARLASVQSFLADVGCDMNTIKVLAMLPGGEGLAATDAISIMREGTINDFKKKTTTPAAPAPRTGG